MLASLASNRRQTTFRLRADLLDRLDAVLTLLMMLCTWLSTKTKIFWLKDAGREDYFNSVISATLDQ